MTESRPNPPNRKKNRLRVALIVGVVALLVVLGMFLTSERKDTPARAYIRDALEPYLDSLAYQLCEVKHLAAPDAPGRIVCPGPPEGYKKSPGNGTP